MGKEKHYKAFISYSHEDEEFGSWLHKELEKYKIPKKLREDYPNLPKTLFPIFRDRYELNAGDDLGIEIPKALKNSDVLIVVCSTDSANSKWVNKEIVEFKKLHGENKIFPIIVNGEPFAKGSDKFEDSLECFPEALKYKVNREGGLTDEKTSILASNTIEKEDGRELAKLKLISGILGVPFGIFNDREKKEQNKRRAFLISSLGVVSSLAGISALKWSEADEKTLKVQKMLYESIIKQGISHRDFFNHPLKSKFIFANAISKSISETEEKNAKILYNSVQRDIKLKLILEHNDVILGVILSKDEQRILFWSEDNTIRICDTNTGKELLVLQHQNNIKGVILSKDEQRILCWSYKSLKLWNLNTGKELLSINEYINGAIFSPDETNISSWNEKKIIFWDSSNGKRLFFLEHDSDVSGIIFNKDSKKILSWSNNLFYGTLYLWDNTNNRQLLHIKHTRIIEEAIFNQNETKILSWGYNDIYLWEYNRGKELLHLKHDSYILGVVFSPNEKTILSWSRDYSVRLWDSDSGKELLYLKHNNIVLGAIFSKDEKSIFSWGFNDGLNIWSLYKHEKSIILKHNNTVYGIILDKHEQKILSWSDDNTVNLQNMKNNKILKFKHDSSVEGAIFTKDESKILSWSKTIHLWDIKNGKELLKLEHNDIMSWNYNTIGKAIFTKDESKILSWSNNNIYLWNIKSGKELLKLKDNDIILGAIFTKNENNILSWSSNNTICLWDINNSTKILSLKHNDTINGVIMNKNENNILSWSDDKTICVWDKQTGKKLLNLKHSHYVKKAILSKDEQTILSYCSDNRIYLWNIYNGQELLHIKFYNWPIRGVFFDKYEKNIISFNSKGHVEFISLYSNQKLPKKYYPLEVERESGTYLDENTNEIKNLSKKEWLQKKKEYEQILKEEPQ